MNECQLLEQNGDAKPESVTRDWVEEECRGASGSLRFATPKGFWSQDAIDHWGVGYVSHGFPVVGTW